MRLYLESKKSEKPYRATACNYRWSLMLHPEVPKRRSYMRLNEEDWGMGDEERAW